MTEESAVKVCVRVRPLIAREESDGSEDTKPVQLFWKADRKSIHQVDDGNSTKSFSFDRVFIAEETTNQLYQDIAKPLVVSTVEGYNGTIFAYGQTSSGKTFTMMGSDRIPGVIPLAVEDVFQTIKNCPKKEFLLRVSYMEIYNETVTDLLVDSWKRKPLEVREAINKNIYVADLTEELVTSPAQALAWIRKGEKNRHYGKTKMNQRSSRSHTIFRMILESRERSDPASGENADGAIIVSHLNLVDLAGSERASQTGAEGARFKEGCNINRSLFTLGQVIKKLTDESQKGFTNYRDSKLTRILQNSLGGNAKTVIICTITPVALDETLSTLQFASTAKKMKNDPHVTEVDDDGALLKRYRNEIVDLKRRLNEVSSVTQTTVTEKEVLSQLLQEKDQLQREQEDRIKNLTKLIVTSSNLVPVKRMPKRRVTWGGKMLRLARLSACEDGTSDLSFAESFTRKRKADRSCLMDLTEDDEDFDSQWEIPDEPSDDMEMSQSSVTTRSFGDSPKDFVSPDRMLELSGKVSNLKLQLEMESQQKEEAMIKVETLDGRVAELELQLQAEATQKQEALEKMQTSEQRAAELDLQLKTQAQQKLEAMENVEMLGLRVTDLERQLEEQSNAQSDAYKQMRREFEETIQLCETLATEKDMVVTERDYLKQELGMFIEQTDSLEKEKTALSKELEEKREMDEFKSLEEEFRKEHESELQNEISSLKKAMESSERQCLELQKKLESVSEELKMKTQFAEDLQSMNGKDLVQEVAKLRRSLDDAEGLSRDTKKEWAVLRSRNIALEEMTATLTANHDKMEAEVKNLSSQLEAEKSRYRKMQSDLQKELNVAFDENTKLTTLLDGKVPKNLIDSVELERTVTNLNKELAASREAEGALKAQLEELASLQALPDKVDDLIKQVCELTEELCAVQSQRDSLLSAQAVGQEEAQQLRGCLQASQDEIIKIQAEFSASAQRENDLNQQCTDATLQLESLRSDVERSDAEKSQLMATIEETGLRLEESDQQKASMEEKLNEMQQLMKDLEEKLADSEVSRTTEEEISKELQEQLNQLTEELQCVRAEKGTLLSEGSVAVQSSAEEMEKLLSTVSTLTAERDQLKMDLQENVQMAAETQGLLHSLQEEFQEQKRKNSDLVKLNEQKGSTFGGNMLNLSQELQSVQNEKETLLMAGVQTSADEMEKLLSVVTSLTAERDQLKMDLQENVEMMIENQEELRTALEKNYKQKERIKRLETAQTSNLDGSPSDMGAQLLELQTNIQRLTEELESVRAERDSLLSEMTADSQASTEEMKELQCRVTSLSEERDQLQETLDTLRQEKNQLRAELEDKMDTLQTEIRTLTEKMEGVEAEKDSLLSEKEASCQASTEEMKELQCRVTSLSEERDQLQETLDTLRQEKNQLRAELEDKMDMIVQAKTEFNQPEMLSSELQAQDERAEQLQQEIEKLQATLQAVSEQKSHMEAELQRNIEMASESQTLLHSIQEQLREQSERSVDLERLGQEQQAQLEQQVAETQGLLHSLQEQKQKNLDLVNLSQQKECNLEQCMKALTEELESVRAERNALLFEKEASCQASPEEMKELLCRVTSLSEERDQLQETLDALRQEKNQLRAELEDKMDMLQCELQQQLSFEPQSLKEEQEAQQLLQLEEHLEKSKEEVSQLKTDLQENVELMIENQEELRAAQEKVRVLQDEVNLLRSQKAELESRQGGESDAENTFQSQELQNQIQRLTEELESVRAERDSLQSEMTADSQASTEEMKELQCRVTSLSEERDQLQETLDTLRQEKNQLRAELEDKMDTLQTEIRTLTEKMEGVEAEKDSLLSEKEASCQASTEEMKELQCRVTSLSEDRDQLQETLDTLRQEKNQLRAELEDKMDTLQTEIRTLTEKMEGVEAEKDSLLSEKEASCQASTEEMKELQCRVTSLSEERDQLQETLDTLRQEKNQLRAELEDKMDIVQTEASTTQDLLKSIQEELCEQKQMNSDLEEKQCKLDQQIKTLTEKLEGVEAEKDGLLSEKEASCQASTEEMKELQCNVTFLSEERDQLQETLDTLRQEKNQLRAELEDKMDMISAIQEKLRQQEQQQAERGEQETRLQQEVQQLEEQLKILREKQTHTKAEADASQQSLSDANTIISTLREQLSSLDQSTSVVKKAASSRLQDSTLQLQESFKKFHHFISTCSKYNSRALDKALRVKHPCLTSLPEPTMNAYSAVCQLGLQTAQTLGNIGEHLQGRAQDYRNLFEELVKKDLSVFEERRLQDVLLCRAQAPNYSIKDEDFHTLWEHRLTELLDKRQLYLQKMGSILAKLWASMASYPSELSAEITERERFKEQLQAVCTSQPISFSSLDEILSCELKRRSAVAHSRKASLQGIIDEQHGLCEELKQLEAQADSQLREERSKRFTLQQALQAAPLKTELSLLKDNQELALKLEQAQEQVKAVCVQIEQLEEAQIKANNRVSNHKQATQLLQTELQDSRAQVEEKDNTIQSLRSKLRESEKNASPSAVELEKLRTKLFKMEVEMSSASDQHQKEIQKMTTVLNEKEESLRKLKETLRKSQQQGEDSFLQGEDLHARLTNPRGLVIKSSILLEKNKLEEEIKQLQVKITELESLVSSQHAEIAKWKSRAIKLKVKSKAEPDRPPSPCTPTKRTLPMTSDSNFLNSPKKFLVTPKKIMESPRKLMDSPKVSLHDSPKSRFFDVSGNSELLSRTCPKQFFDNSSLGTIPDAGRQDEWWPQSPKQEDMCKQQ